jgi:5-(carboxyamino)imidazole ribonucleotide synthase
MAHPSPLAPPAVIGILGGGQLGRMLAQAARAMGYRIAVLDPDPVARRAAVADQLVVGSYDDIGAALRLAELSDVVTYELEHVAAARAAIEALEPAVPTRPGRGPLLVTQDRLAERRFVEAAGVAVAPWREVRSVADARSAADALGLPLRLKLPVGGYDGRGQLRIVEAAELDDAWVRLGRPPVSSLLAERELDFEAELSNRDRSLGRWRGRDLPDRAERPRCRDPRGIRGPGAHPGRCRGLRRRDRPFAGRGDGPLRHPYGRALPDG